MQQSIDYLVCDECGRVYNEHATVDGDIENERACSEYDGWEITNDSDLCSDCSNQPFEEPDMDDMMAGHNEEDIPPTYCDVCGKELEESSGYVGELIKYCPNKEHGIRYEDGEDALRKAK